jgi:benzoyl-CoA reductase subunit C
MAIASTQKPYHLLPAQNESVRRWKEAGKKVFGYVCINVPEEIMYAADILPLRILGTTEDVVAAHNYCATFLCHRMKSILELGLKGELSLLDGIVMGYACEGGMTTMQPLLENVPFPYSEYLLLPHSRRPDAYVFFHKELAHFKKTVEEFTGKEVTEESLTRAIQVYNENRALLKEIYDLRGREEPPRLSGAEVAEVVLSSMLMPKEEHNKLLRELRERMSRRDRLPSGDGPRIHISGTILPPDLELFQLVEELGGIVVSDDLCTGSRYFWGQVDASKPPLEALVEYYLYAKSHCPWVYGDETWEKRAQYVKEMLQTYRVDGVISCAQKWCDPFLFHQPILVGELKSLGFPVLSIEVDQAFDIAPLRTRLQAFFEMVEEGKGR